MEEMVNQISEPIIQLAAYLIKFAVGYLLVGVIIFLSGNLGYWTIKTVGVRSKKVNEILQDLAHWRVIYQGPFLLILVAPYLIIPLLIVLFIYMVFFR